MIVYANSIWLDKLTTLADVFSAITLWFSKKTKEKIFPDTFTEQPLRIFGDDSKLEIIKTDHSYPIIYSLRYSQRDNEVPGRQWITEIGIRKLDLESELQISFLVKTSEISINVPPPQHTTRPLVILELLNKCRPSIRTIGTCVRCLSNQNDIVDLSYEIDLPERTYPIILVSPSPEGSYLVELDKLLFQTIGLAEIIQIPIDANTYYISDVLGKNRSAYNGAINILFPRISRRGSSYVPTRLFLADDLLQMTKNGKNIENEFLTEICYRVNLPNSWQHISQDTVKEAIRTAEINRISKDTLEIDELRRYLSLLQESTNQKDKENSELRTAINSLRSENEYYTSEFDNADEERKILKNKVEALSLQIGDLIDNKQKLDDEDGNIKLIKGLLGKLINKSITPAESLEFISKLFPERITILESAYKSAEDSIHFVDCVSVFDLLWKLVTEYWFVLNSGKGDNEARIIFGNAYAAKESETVEKKKEAHRRRTFIYKDKEIFMAKHLKCGNKKSIAETLRIHFEWVFEEKRIVIGYCGQHLDFN